MSLPNTLFVTWDGPSTNYLQSLFLPIFSELQDKNVSEFSVLQIGWGRERNGGNAAQVAESLGVKYQYIPVSNKKNLSLIPAFIKASLIISRHMRRENAYVMPRSIIPAALVIATRIIIRSGRLIYDADGLMMEERVEFGGWSREGLAYKLCRGIEKKIIELSSAVMTRTDACRSALIERNGLANYPPIITIANSKNERNYRLVSQDERVFIRRKYGLPEDGIALVYLGSLGPQYKPELIMEIVKRISLIRDDAYLLIITSDLTKAKNHIRESGIDPARIKSVRLTTGQVAEVLSAMDLGFCLREPTFSQMAISPIKVTEYVLSGLPFIYNKGVGDLEFKFTDSKFAFMMNDWSASETQRACEWVLSNCRYKSNINGKLIRDSGIKHFAISSNLFLYKLLYQVAK